MNIPLNVLIDAEQALEMLREVADPYLNKEQFMQALRSWSALQAHVKCITENISVETV